MLVDEVVVDELLFAVLEFEVLAALLVFVLVFVFVFVLVFVFVFV